MVAELSGHTMTGPLLCVRAVSKSFPGLRALDDVSLELRSGEIVALVGQNGSGKSTLVKVVTGVHSADPGGVVEVAGPDGQLLQGAEAHARVRVIHQDLGLIGGLSTVENLDLGVALRGRELRPTRRRAERVRARELLGSFGVELDVDAPVTQLSAAERAIVAIARALDGWDRPERVLILDEPTTALHGDEVERLFAAVRGVARRGAGLVFISHRLDEVLQLADRVVALRDGRLVADVAACDVDHDKLVRMIAGHDLAAHQSRALERRDVRGSRTPALALRGLRGETVDGVDLDVHAGAIVGVSGLLGSGREHLCGLVFGATARRAGQVLVAGEELRGAGGPGVAITAGLAFVPADRHARGAVMSMSARENLTLPQLGPLRRAMGWLDGSAERDEAADWTARVGLSPPEPERPLELFSGGNQQKVVLAKWLRTAPRVLLLDEPTQGVDVGAKAAIYSLIERAASEGAAVVVASSDEEELVTICDRVVVLREGRIAAQLAGAELEETRLVLEGLGVRAREAEAIFGATTEVRNA
ncbi:MAG TPA: sugar ABC transporter ATP-binding protein [Baekduia sp.]